MRSVGSRLARSLLSAGLALAGLGCSPKATPSPLALAGVNHFPTGEAFLIFAVPSDGIAEDTAYVENSQVYGTSPLASRLANLFSAGETGELRIVIGGPSSEKSSQVVIDALRLNEGHTLGGLVMVFVGTQRDAEKVRAALEPKLGTLLHSELPRDLLQQNSRR